MTGFEFYLGLVFGFIGGFVAAWIMVALCCQATKASRNRKLLHRQLEQIEASYPKGLCQ